MVAAVCTQHQWSIECCDVFITTATTMAMQLLFCRAIGEEGKQGRSENIFWFTSITLRIKIVRAFVPQKLS